MVVVVVLMVVVILLLLVLMLMISIVLILSCGEMNRRTFTDEEGKQKALRLTS